MWLFLVKQSKPCTACQGEGKRKMRTWKLGQGFVPGKRRPCRTCGGSGIVPG